MPTASTPSLRETRKVRPGVEVLNEAVYRPAAQLLVAPLARAGVRPETVVLVHTVLGLLAAAQVARGGRLSPALLLQLKTVLDNADGQLARATGQTTAVGRYLDTEMDTLVNAALFVAIDRRWGPPALAVLSLLLTADFLLERDYRRARGEVFREPPRDTGGGPVLAALEAVYRAWFVPQERVLDGLFESRFRAAGGTDADREAYTPQLATHVAANLGLTTQLALAGLCIALGRPRAYLATVPVQATLLAGVQLWREHRVRSRRPA